MKLQLFINNKLFNEIDLPKMDFKTLNFEERTTLREKVFKSYTESFLKMNDGIIKQSKTWELRAVVMSDFFKHLHPIPTERPAPVYSNKGYLSLTGS